jgi:hypothetical protein
VKKKIGQYKNKKGTKGLSYLIKKIGLDRFANDGRDDTNQEEIIRTFYTVKKLLDKPYDKVTGKKISITEIHNIINYKIYGNMFAHRGKNPPRQLKEAIKAFSDAIFEGLQSKKINDSFIGECF